MTSCKEARFYLKNCPNVKIDGNNDGVPCESQWCNKKMHIGIGTAITNRPYPDMHTITHKSDHQVIAYKILGDMVFNLLF